jgi:hypothetical protein
MGIREDALRAYGAEVAMNKVQEELAAERWAESKREQIEKISNEALAFVRKWEGKFRFAGKATSFQCTTSADKVGDPREYTTVKFSVDGISFVCRNHYDSTVAGSGYSWLITLDGSPHGPYITDLVTLGESLAKHGKVQANPRDVWVKA